MQENKTSRHQAASRIALAVLDYDDTDNDGDDDDDGDDGAS